jgi:hypothetical protein
MMLTSASCCIRCGREVSVEEPFKVDTNGFVICPNHPWAEGDIKDAAAPADKEQEDGE